MSNIVAQLQARRRQDVVLASGLKVGFHFPDLQECILQIGRIPSNGLTGIVGEPTEEQAAALLRDEPDAVKQGWEYRKRVVMAMLDAIDGEDIDPQDDREAIVGVLSPQDRDELFTIATERTDRGEA